MRRIRYRAGLPFFFCILWISAGVILSASDAQSTVKPEELHARAAVLMDADSGRVLYEKNGYEKLPMASTTKIMTCILALEQGNLTDVVTASGNAAGQPKVHLGMREGEQFYLKDLLYSLMLESHNDSAVAIAEHVGGSVEDFAGMMNAKAAKLGCMDTYFVTPNGLDAYDEGGTHSTTARDLARIMRYCIMESPKRDLFLGITQTQDYSFADVEGRRTFSCVNHNAFLTMMDGALSGKTGFTGNAGYCYVGALRRDERTFIVSLLACGWPNNKTYKWADTKYLMQYGIAHYQYADVFDRETLFPELFVEDGIEPYTQIDYEIPEGERKLKLLLREGEEVRVEYEVPEALQAPVEAGDVVGTATYYLEDGKVAQYDLVSLNSVPAITFSWCFGKVWEAYVL